MQPEMPVRPTLQSTPLRKDEAARLAVLNACQILNSEPEPELDLLVGHAARLAGTPIALISLVDETQQWFKARIGLAITHTACDISFCRHTILQRAPFIVSDARADDRFADNPLVVGEPRIVFYAGWPLVTHDGYALGSLCVIDRVPRELSEAQQESMSLLARQVILALELRRGRSRGVRPTAAPLAQLLQRHSAIESARRAQAQLAQLVVHDLKNPLTVISGNVAFVLENTSLESDFDEALRDVLISTQHMQDMLLDLLDVWRADNDDGKLIADRHLVDVAALLREAIGHGHARNARLALKLDREELPFMADAQLLVRLVMNLIDNAQRYAPAGSEIEVSAQPLPEGIEISVADTGQGIADAHKTRVFETFARLERTTARTGKGLGLMFCRLAAEAHGGRIWVEDNRPRGARFRVLLPPPATAP
jgi:signal transduction histidine kinase